jgi:hypothetical protein
MLAALVASGTPGAVTLLSGDLWRTVGGAGTHCLPIDVLRVRLDDGAEHIAAAHVVARSRFARRWLVVMNAQYWRRYDLGPRSHPNDGLADVTTGAVSWADLVKIARRARTGSHLPHPSLHTDRVAEGHWMLDKPLAVRIDGRRVGWARHSIAIAVEPDAVIVAPRVG